MFLVHLIDVVLNLQQCAEVPGAISDNYPGYAFTAIGAAFANQGYWAQATLLDTISFRGLGVWAILLYVCAAMGGLIGVAIGMPPRNYLWFFMGPAVYGWLVESRQDVRGVHWVIPCAPATRYDTMQREVWRLAEVGLTNTAAMKYRIFTPQPGGLFGTANVSFNLANGPSRDVPVAMPFAWFDSVVSGSIYALVAWTGVTRLAAPDNPNNSNIAYNPADLGSLVTSTDWVLYADMKWPAMEEITSATLVSPELRDAFASFFVWCGDKLRSVTVEGPLAAAQTSKGRNLPDTVFSCGTSGCPTPRTVYSGPRLALFGERVPFPESLKSYLADRGATNGAGFWYSIVNAAGSGATSSDLDTWTGSDTISCDEWLTTLMMGFRFEAQHRYIKFYETVRPEGITDPAVNENLLVTSLLYGWDIK